jgi:hypothetical protein
MGAQRRFQRFNIAIMNVTGRIVWSHVVTIKDITHDFVILSTDARMNLGKKYILHIEHQGDGFNVSGTVTASSIDKLTLTPEGETSPLYRTEISFDNDNAAMKESVNRLIRLLTKGDMPKVSELKLWIDIPGEANAVTETYRVKEIAMGGMRIECLTPHEVGCTFRLLMSLPDVATLRISAKIVWCIQSLEDYDGSYDLGLAFTDMSEADLTRLESFVQHLQEPQMTDADLWKQEKI